MVICRRWIFRWIEMGHGRTRLGRSPPAAAAVTHPPLLPSPPQTIPPTTPTTTTTITTTHHQEVEWGGSEAQGEQLYQQQTLLQAPPFPTLPSPRSGCSPRHTATPTPTTCTASPSPPGPGLHCHRTTTPSTSPLIWMATTKRAALQTCPKTRTRSRSQETHTHTCSARCTMNTATRWWRASRQRREIV